MKLTAGGVNYGKLTAEQQKALDNYVKTLGVPPGPPTQQGIYATPEFTGDPYPSEVIKPVEENQEPPEGWPRNPVFNAPGDVPGPPVQFGPTVEPTTVMSGEGFTGIGLPENDIFYFHPDHLGSTSYITSRNGSISQHVEYIAFGEVLFEEHSSSFSSPYLFNGKELDRETNLSYYGARYLDMKTSLWLSVDIMASRYPEISPYAYCGNNPVNAIDPDGKHIIYLNSSTAVHGLGHAAVLIGNDREGWRYLSMNGTGEGAAAFGSSKFEDLGNIKYDKDTQKGNDFRGTGMTATQVMKAVNNSNPKEDHEYDRAIRVVTNSFEDGLAYAAAKKQAGLPDYNLFGSSCIDVPQEALEAVVAHRLNVQSKKDPQFWDKHLSFYDANKYGFHMLAPNDWYNDLLGGIFNNFVKTINSDLKTNPIQVRKMPVTTVVVGPIEEL